METDLVLTVEQSLEKLCPHKKDVEDRKLIVRFSKRVESSEDGNEVATDSPIENLEQPITSPPVSPIVLTLEIKPNDSLLSLQKKLQVSNSQLLVCKIFIC